MNTATNELAINKGVPPQKKKRTLEDKVNSVNQGWDVLGELGENKFEIPLRKKQVNVETLEKNIASVAKNDSEIIRLHEEQEKSSVSAIQKEIHTIRQNQKSFDSESISVVPEKPASEIEQKSILVNVPLSNVQKTTTHTSVQEDIIQPVVKAQTVQSAPVQASPQVEQSLQVKTASKTKEEILENKNVFLRLVMKGLAQIYVDKTTSLFNPVVFIIKNYRFLLQTTLLLGIPALITWVLFTKIASLQTSLSSVSQPMYIFYACMFYTAALFLCLTLQVVLSGFWSMLKKSMSEVAIKASETTSK